jgi:hypothetical protein
MTIKTTRWYPDTCDCVFDYEWDDAQPESTRVHTFKDVVKECESHSHLQNNNKKDMYDSSLEENNRKNFTIFELLDKAAADFGEPDPQSGAIILKKNIGVSWTWSGTSPNRVLTFTVTGITLTSQKRTQAQNFLNNRFGVGKVIFVNS